MEKGIMKFDRLPYAAQGEQVNVEEINNSRVVRVHSLKGNGNCFQLRRDVATGSEICPDCGERILTPDERRNNYRCKMCTEVEEFGV